MWKSIKNKPTRNGIYAVARFEGDKLIDLDINWALCDDYWGPNNLGWQERIQPTHWMSRADYRKTLENAPREPF